MKNIFIQYKLKFFNNCQNTENEKRDEILTVIPSETTSYTGCGCMGHTRT